MLEGGPTPIVVCKLQRFSDFNKEITVLIARYSSLLYPHDESGLKWYRDEVV
jgi:hypothetical protein